MVRDPEGPDLAQSWVFRSGQFVVSLVAVSGTPLWVFASRFCFCSCAQRRREVPLERERARRLRVGCVTWGGSWVTAVVVVACFSAEAWSRGGDTRRMTFEAPILGVPVCRSPARAGASAGGVACPVVGCGRCTEVCGVAGLDLSIVGLWSPRGDASVAGGGGTARVWMLLSRRTDARICSCRPTPLWSAIETACAA